LKVLVVNNHPLRVCYFGTYRENYSRNQMMIAGLRENGVIVVECHETLWRGIDDRVRVVSGAWLKPSFWWRIIVTYWRLLKNYLQVGDYDILIVGYPGQFDVFLARILSWIRHKPLVWDVFMSIYLISVERGLDKRNVFSIKLLHLLEGTALRLPELLILDTSEYVRWFEQNYRISPERFRLVPTGADDRIFFPLPHSTSVDGKFRILYSGTFIPNHGVMYIVEAAKLLGDEPLILFEFIGNGPELEKAHQFVINNRMTNVYFTEWMEKDQLPQHISQADVCLGAFGTTPQSLMTVQNKIYEAIAMGKPLISGDSPAIRQVFIHGQHIYLCDRASGKSLADAILALFGDSALRERIARNGYHLYKEKYDLLHNGKLFTTHLGEIVR
jgi:glycosyltransferase involved in cell wall biosynthesis